LAQGAGRPRRYCTDACRYQAYRRRRAKPVYFRSQSDNWSTDPAFFAQLDEEFDFTLDACASASNAKCERYFTIQDDGLSQIWTGRTWVNPPYGRTIARWIAKGLQSVRQGSAELVVLLVPSKTDTRWWHELCVQGEIRYIKGRLRFGDLKYPAPFPSARVVFRKGKILTQPGSDSACVSPAEDGAA
jgi:phage N-6-adenine-methyltransferase